MSETQRFVDATTLGVLCWRVAQVGVLTHLDTIESVVRYDRSADTDATHEFFFDLTKAFANPQTIVNKWRNAVLILPNGRQEPMDPNALLQALTRYRQSKVSTEPEQRTTEKK